jgi:hypothetical protein
VSCFWVWRKSLENKQTNKTEGCVTTMALPFTLKKYLRAKQELWKLKYFTLQKYNLQKNPLKETKLLQCIITLL